MEISKDTWRALALAALLTLILTAGLLKFGGAYDYHNLEARIEGMEKEQEKLFIGQDRLAMEQDRMKGKVEVMRNQLGNEWFYREIKQ